MFLQSKCKKSRFIAKIHKKDPSIIHSVKNKRKVFGDIAQKRF